MHWSNAERTLFLDKMVSCVTPDKLFARMENLGGNQPSPDCFSVQNCHSFNDQVQCILAHVRVWTADTSNDLMSRLEEVDYSLMCAFYDKVAQTVQEP